MTEELSDKVRKGLLRTGIPEDQLEDITLISEREFRRKIEDTIMQYKTSIMKLQSVYRKSKDLQEDKQLKYYLNPLGQVGYIVTGDKDMGFDLE